LSRGRKAKSEAVLFVPACELCAHIPKSHFCGRPLTQVRHQRGEALFGGLRRFAGRGLEYALKKKLIAALGSKAASSAGC